VFEANIGERAAGRGGNGPPVLSKTQDLIGGKARRQYGIDKGEEGKMPMGKVEFVQDASSSGAEDASGTDLGERTEREGEKREE